MLLPDNVPALPWRKLREQFKSRRPGAPSQQAQTTEFKELQKDNITFYGCNRPPDREHALPLALLHPVFGAFIDDAKTIAPTREDYATAHRLKMDMCDFYPNEGDRRQKICVALQEYGIGINPGPVGASEHKTDGHVCTTTHPKFILELKNEIGSKGAEPSLQAFLYYRIFLDEYKLWDDDSCSPCFIAFLAGQPQP